MPTMITINSEIIMPDGLKGIVVEVLPIGELRILGLDGEEYFYYPEDVEEQEPQHCTAYYADRDEW